MSKPYFDRPVKAAKDFAVNMTCNIASHFLLHETDVYWLKNGLEKLKFETTGNQEGLLQSTTINWQPLLMTATFTRDIISVLCLHQGL